jgi:hypothetical protein
VSAAALAKVEAQLAAGFAEGAVALAGGGRPSAAAAAPRQQVCFQKPGADELGSSDGAWPNKFGFGLNHSPSVNYYQEILALDFRLPNVSQA